MKKLSIITAMIVSFTSIGIAQDSKETDNREKFQVGLKAGLNYSNVYDAQGEQFTSKAKFGGAIGAFMDIPFCKYIGIQPGALISQKGFEATGMVLGGKYDFTRTTTYIDVPLLFELKPIEFFSLLAGPQFSYLINQRDVFSNATTSSAQEQEFKNDNIRKNIFGITGGFDINWRHITMGARVNWDVQDNNSNGTSTTPRYKNVWFQGTFGYKLYKK